MRNLLIIVVVLLVFCGLALPASLGAASAQERPLQTDEVHRGPFGVPTAQVVAVTLGLCLLVICVLLHYESLRILSRLLMKLETIPRLRVVFLILGLIIVHQAEVWIWAWGYFGASFYPSLGQLVGGAHTLMTFVYFSASTYTTLGFGDIVPEGPIRFLSATEAILGLVLVGWSTAFTFLEMQRFWKDEV